MALPLTASHRGKGAPDRALIQILRRTRSSRLGSRDAPLSSFWQVIGWWEARRPVFNLVVAAAGVLSSAAMLVTAVVTERFAGIPIGLPDPPIIAILGVVLFAVCANVCYTGGWVAELLVRRVWADEAEPFATLMFTLGIWFAVVLTLLPGILIGASGLVAVVARALGYDVAVSE